MQIEADINHQLAEVVDRLATGPATAFELLSVAALRDRRPVATRYEVSLVLARLAYLEDLGRIKAISTDDKILYALSD